MEPGSTASNSAIPTSQPLANLMGTLIALLTLIVPVIAIAYFSSNQFFSDSFSSEEFSANQSWQVPPHLLESKE